MTVTYIWNVQHGSRLWDGVIYCVHAPGQYYSAGPLNTLTTYPTSLLWELHWAPRRRELQGYKRDPAAGRPAPWSGSGPGSSTLWRTRRVCSSERIPVQNSQHQPGSMCHLQWNRQGVRRSPPERGNIFTLTLTLWSACWSTRYTKSWVSHCSFFTWG